MKKNYIYLILIICFFTTKVSAQDYFTLPMALSEVEAHSDYQNWLNSIEKIEHKIISILNKQNPTLFINGQPISLTYKTKQQTSTISTSLSLNFSQKFFSGTSLSASLSTGKDLTSNNLPWNIKWSLSLDQTILPNPKLGSEQRDVLYSQNSIISLERQRDYVLQQALYKIEELYRQTQLVEARLIFAENALQNELQNSSIIAKKTIIGEASESDRITARLGVLKAEKELDQARINADNTKKRLQEMLSLNELPFLPPLDLDLFLKDSLSLESKEIDFPIETHPLLLQYLVEVEKAQTDLLAAKEGLKPSASLALRVGEAQNTNEFQVGASLSVNYGIWDGGQKKDAVLTQEDYLKSCQQNYEDELTLLINRFQESVQLLGNKFRELEISDLMLEKALLEYEAAKTQHSLGIIDSLTFEKQKMQLLQAQLNNWENCFQYNLSFRKIAAGIFEEY